MAGWHHWLDGCESEWTPEIGDGQGGLACRDSWGRKESDSTEGLIWSDLLWFKKCKTIGKGIVLGNENTKRRWNKARTSGNISNNQYWKFSQINMKPQSTDAESSENSKKINDKNKTIPLHLGMSHSNYRKQNRRSWSMHTEKHLIYEENVDESQQTSCHWQYKQKQ